MSTLKTTFLMALLTVIVVTAGAALGGQRGMLVAFLFALAMNGVSYWFSDKIVLRMYGAQEVAPEQAPKLYRIVQELALLFGLGVYFVRGGEKAMEFLTGYVIEWSLSVDNLFVFLVIFSYFAVPRR